MVAGAGIIGASIAYHLAKLGQKVTVIEKTAPASEASGGTFAWINATWAKQPRHYHRLSQDSVKYWHILQKELSLPVRWGGSLEWFEDQSRQNLLAQQIDQQKDWGEKARMLSEAEVQDLEPNLSVEGIDRAAFSGNDGAVDSILATQRLLDKAAEFGAKIVYPCELQGVTYRNDKLDQVSTSHGTLDADKLILATGANASAPKEFAGISIPQRTRPGIIVTTEPTQRLVHHVISAPGVHMHQRDDGCIVLGEQSGPPKTQAHEQRLRLRPNHFPTDDIAREHANRILERATDFVPKIKGVGVKDVRIGWRPLPLDGHPVLGFSTQRPDVYLAIMHSGVTLAAIVGLLAAKQVTEEPPGQPLEPFRPNRKFEEIRRY